MKSLKEYGRGLPLDTVGLGPKVEARLGYYDIKTVGDLERCFGAWHEGSDLHDAIILLDIHGLGVGKLNKVRAAMAEFGLELRDEKQLKRMRMRGL